MPLQAAQAGRRTSAAAVRLARPSRALRIARQRCYPSSPCCRDKSVLMLLPRGARLPDALPSRVLGCSRGRRSAGVPHCQRRRRRTCGGDSIAAAQRPPATSNLWLLRSPCHQQALSAIGRRGIKATGSRRPSRGMSERVTRHRGRARWRLPAAIGAAVKRRHRGRARQRLPAAIGAAVKRRRENWEARPRGN